MEFMIYILIGLASSAALIAIGKFVIYPLIHRDGDFYEKFDRNKKGDGGDFFG